MNRIKFRAKKILYPGLDLHTRSRYRLLPQFFVQGNVDTLDAGCGNGALSYAAYCKGNRVLAVSFDSKQISNNRAFFENLKIEKERLSFEVMNLYDLGTMNKKFDQIICSETLEHIRNDRQIVEYFYNLLKPQGILHLCCPYALHPEHHLGRQDGPEDGGHVRDGYTWEDYAALLKPTGFEIINEIGVGSPWVVIPDKVLRSVRHRFGDALGVLLFPLFYWPVLLDFVDPKVPFSLYVQARKPMPLLRDGLPKWTECYS